MSNALKNTRPFLIKLFNALRIPTTLDAEKLLQTAQKKTGLKDFGPGNLKEALTQLVASINNEAKLHPFGRFITKQRLLNVLQNRLRVEAIFKNHPEINDLEIKAPIIITGLQRTGTTRLHRLLAAHPDVRSLSSWEALNPAPFDKDDNNKKRKSFAKTAENALRFMSPDFFAIHPVEFEAPEEDVLLNDMTLISAVSEATMFVPSFAEWLTSQDAIFPYQYMKRILQLLQWQNPKERWVLKTPEHLGNMAAIHKVFPDAKIIHTYRNPLNVIPSFSSMVYYSNRIFSDEVNAEKLARIWMQKDVDMLQSAFKFWNENPDLPVLSISYYDMIKNYEKQLEKIMEFSKLPWGEQEKNHVKQVNSNNVQHKYGVHKYSLDQFNIRKEEVQEAFDFYNKHFNLKDE